ncbi:hypothetical protein GCM10022419_108150 [Nonomuraea rosea]|uniref:Uncharacterized protein n=1 Tax=Nonomuraea rosea TaxID=638574 RepID=A0ABP6ZDL1_9ACTN
MASNPAAAELSVKVMRAPAATAAKAVLGGVKRWITLDMRGSREPFGWRLDCPCEMIMQRSDASMVAWIMADSGQFASLVRTFAHHE